MLSHLYGMASETLTTVSNIWAFQMYSLFCQNMPKILMTRLAFTGVLLFFYRNAIFKENDPRLWLVSKLMSHLNCLSWRKHVITGEKSSKIFGWLILCSNLLGGFRDQHGTLWIISNIFFFCHDTPYIDGWGGWRWVSGNVCWIPGLLKGSTSCLWKSGKHVWLVRPACFIRVPHPKMSLPRGWWSRHESYIEIRFEHVCSPYKTMFMNMNALNFPTWFCRE